MSDDVKAKSNAKTDGQSVNPTKPVDSEEQPVNPRTLEKDKTEDESSFSAAAMLAMAEENERQMTPGTKAKLAAYRKFNESNKGMIIKDYADFDLQLMILPGSYKNEAPTSKSDAYIPNDFLSGKVMIKSKIDARIKVMLPVTQAIAIAHYMQPFLDTYPDVVQYMAALEREINMRKASADPFALGK